jgi:hypothetical protein
MQGGTSTCTRCRARSCAARGEWTCARAGARCTLSASMARARRGQSEGRGGAYGRHGRLAPVVQRGRCLWECSGAVAAAGLLSKLGSLTGALRWASVRGRENGEVGRKSDWHMGSWCFSWAVAHRRLGVGDGESKREGRARSWARLPRGLPLPCVHLHRTRRIRGRERCQQGREGWPARAAS